MQKLWIVTSILVITSVFIYSMTYLSDNNKCSWVRIYECKKEENKNLVSSEKYIELKNTWDLFLKSCKPTIKEEENTYFLDYSKCDLKININKEKPSVDSVKINWKNLTREEINSNF